MITVFCCNLLVTRKLLSFKPGCNLFKRYLKAFARLWVSEKLIMHPLHSVDIEQNLNFQECEISHPPYIISDNLKIAEIKYMPKGILSRMLTPL